MKKRKIILIYRKQFLHVYSIEFVFDQLQLSLRKNFNIKKYILLRFSNSIFNRVVNIVLILRLRHKIAHVTGDVHYAILGLWFCKRILTIHDLAFIHQNKGVKRSILKWLYIILPVKFAHHITVVSEATKVNLLNYVNVDSSKITIIHNFISDVFQPVNNRKFNSTKPQILQIGTAFNKNIHRLAKAIQGISCTLIIVGKLDQSQIEVLNNFDIAYINKLNLTNHELYLEYQQADLLAFISTIEGFGLPILEAQAAGLPVVTSNCSSMPEVAGNGAILVDPLNVKAIRNSILELIENEQLRNKLIQNGFENVKRFSKEKIVAQYAAIYQELELQ